MVCEEKTCTEAVWKW